MATVEMDSLCKVFPGGVEAVRNAKIVVEDKEFVVLLGPSGCGKTTLLRLIAGLETITQGELKIDGRVVNDVKPKDRDIAMVFQSYALYPHMSVFDNMSLALKLKKLPREEIEQRVGDAARILGIADLMSRKPGQLSGGQRQRVAVGRAIVRKPKVFLFDEPLSNLDAKKRVQMRFEISQLHQRLNATIIYVTHDQTEAMTMGNRIVVMKDGTIQQVGKPLEVYRQPANRFVAEFIGSPSMNFARVKRSAPAESFLTSNAGVRIELRNGSLSSVADVDVDVGIRPEHLEVESTVSNAHDLHLSGEIAFLEPLGSETHVHVRIGKETNWVAALRGDKVLEVGQTVELFARSEHVHLFDPENGEPLAAPV